MKDVCLFAHFDQNNKVDDYVLHYLNKIKELNFSIVFISAAQLPRAEVERLKNSCFDVILRENAGLDFGSWSDGFAKYGAAIRGRLLLANDSVYGPIGNLQVALDRLTRSPADFYGLVESAETDAHLSSWFLLFEPWVIQHPEFRSILGQPFSTMTKRQIIERGEVALSRRLTQAGFRYQALYQAVQAGLSRRHSVNPMLVFWHELLFNEGVPFVKIELLRDNPIGREDAATILQTVKQIDPFMGVLIKSHLGRTTRRPPRIFLARLWYAMIRERYDHKQRSWATSAFNQIKLELLTALVWASRWSKATWHLRGKTCTPPSRQDDS